MKDETVPGEKWEFNESVTNAFEDMLSRSIPEYPTMRQACFDLGSRYVQRGTDIVDLGCSRGDALLPFVKRFGAHNRYVGIERSAPMIESAKQKFGGYIANGIVEIEDRDLRGVFPPVHASLILSVLTLQFIPIEHRFRVLRKAYESLAAGGALILVEKVLGATSEIDQRMVEIYYALKRDNGYSQDAIDRKRLSLEGVLVPITARWNEEALTHAGFSSVDCFWRWMNFAGWVAVK